MTEQNNKLRGGFFMKRKLSIILLSFLLTLGMLPLTALAAGAPYALPEGPTNLTAKLKMDDEGIPYFELKWNMPQSVVELAEEITAVAGLDENPLFPGYNTGYIELQFDYKYGKYDWNEGPTVYAYTSFYVDSFVDGNYVFEYRPYDSSNKPDEVTIKSETYQFRVRFESMWGYEGDWVDNYIYSPYSNTVTIGNPDYWSNASAWATPELQKAADAGLIPDILKGADMTKPITREEFCELAVLLYEKMTGKISEPTSPNPFKDTQNPQILKAFKLGITSGTSATTFTPNQLITREQCAAMLFRAIKLIKPDSDFSVAGVKDFPDQKLIAGYAIEAAKYMSKIGIIAGDSKGNFMPKANPSAQQSADYGMALRQQAIAMSVRTYEKLK